MSRTEVVEQTAAEVDTSADRRSRAVLVGVIAAGLLGLLAVYTVGDRDSGLVTQAIATGILLGGVYALVSVGLTLIFGVLGIVNFAQGSMLTLAMYIVYSLGQSLGMPVYAATLLAVPLMFAFGYVVQLTLLNKLDDVRQPRGPAAGHARPLAADRQRAADDLQRPAASRSAPWSTARCTILGALLSWERMIAFLGAVAVAAAL